MESILRNTGFEDLGESDSFSEEEVIPKELQTKDGYLKDGFVVDDDDEIEELKSDMTLNQLVVVNQKMNLIRI